MNKIVRQHYPVEKLPEELRAGLLPGDRVTITLDVEASSPAVALIEAMEAPDRPRRSKAEIDRTMALIRQD